MPAELARRLNTGGYKRALDEIRTVADGLVLPLWNEVQGELPPGMATAATVTADIDPAALVSWIAERTALKIATGEHDRATVRPEELGSGLQSLLELALQQARVETPEVERIIGVEEPEAFLHPSAQRTLARMIAETAAGKRLVSTHSPILVAEAEFGETVLVRDHRFFPPAAVADEIRDAINTALLSGHGAEMAFARSVLLVEGDGDRVFYETLRRRLARASNDGRLDHLTVVPAGSKTAFAPWLRLLASYGSEGDRPIRWLLAADGDGATQVRRAYRDAGMRLPLDVRAALMDASNERNNPDRTVFIAATNEVNRRARHARVAMHLSPVDLEHAALLDCSDASAQTLSDVLALQAETRDELEVALRKRKAAYLRGAMADRLDWSEVSSDTRQVLRRWLEQVVPTATASRLVRTGA
jgi:predicted ATP-dependent endonuclease of OLD family